MLSSFETVLLDRHLRGCESCRAFAASAELQTRLLRSATLERPSTSVALPRQAARARRGLAGMLTAAALAGAAALVVVSPVTLDRSSATQRTAARAPATVVALVSAVPTPAAGVDVPRLRVQPALTDGPVHGLFSLPV
jgi:predicted anti-sigma-YlaC factor YlaD